jgi:hypothetical protein
MVDFILGASEKRSWSRAEPAYADSVTGEIFARISPESPPQTIYATDGSAEMIKMLNEKKAKGAPWNE